MKSNQKIGFGGGCHWCTEAVFQSLIGVSEVEQGYIASDNENSSFSEAVIVHFNPNIITLDTLIEIHIHTHKSTSNHSMRKKYRSTIYTFNQSQTKICEVILKSLQRQFDNTLITQIMSFVAFKKSREAIQDYFLKNPEKPFCKLYINPKLKLLKAKHDMYFMPLNL